MPLIDAALLPGTPIGPDADHDDRVAEFLEAGSDFEIDSKVLEYLDPQLDLTAAGRAVLWDERIIERVYAALCRIAPYISKTGFKPPPGIRPSDLPLLRSRVAQERKPMGIALAKIRTARQREQASVNRIAHEITGMIHHHTLAAARYQLRAGKAKGQVLASLQARIAGARHDLARRLEELVDEAIGQYERGEVIDVEAHIDAIAADVAVPAQDAKETG
jgi:hypothetical protein